VTDYDKGLLISVNEFRMRQHQKVMANFLRCGIESDPFSFDVLPVRHSPFDFPLAFTAFVGSLDRGKVVRGHVLLVSRGRHYFRRHDFLSFGKKVRLVMKPATLLKEPG
jgi:hypothetical protein